MNISKISVMETASSMSIRNKEKNSYASNTCNAQIASKTPNLGTLQAYFLKQNPSFGRLTAEHLNHGAYVDEAKNIFFSLFTFPDVKEVSVVLKRKIGGVVKEFTHALKRDNAERGVFNLKLGAEQAQAGDKYAFNILKSNGENILVPDPYAKRKINYVSPFSEIYDHHAYKWSDGNWTAGKDSRKISRIGEATGLTPFRNANIYEINIPTFTKDGTFESAKAKIDEMIKKGFFKEDGKGAYNAIEIMPIETTFKPGWSYDGVYKGAPLEALGGPDGLKSLVDYAHSKGINMIIDAVPNHFGTDYNPLREIGPYLGADGDFGSKPFLENDFEKNKHVRDFVTNVCGLNWLRDYHFDGLRLDLTHDMNSDFTLRQMIEEVNFHEPHGFVILEDNRVGDTHRLLNPLPRKEHLSEAEHSAEIKPYDTNDTSKVHLDSIGANGRWSYEYEHALNKACNNDISISSLAGTIIDSVKRGDVIYGARQSHDEIGNNDGIKSVVAFARDRLSMFYRVEGSNSCEKGQRAAQAAQRIITEYASGKYQKLSDGARKAFLKEMHVIRDITPEEIEHALNYSIAQNKTSVGLTAILPAAKMRYAGGIAEVEPMRFFREFAGGAEADWMARAKDKGYAIDHTAKDMSVLGSTQYSNEYQKIIDQTNRFEIDLNRLATSHPASSSGWIVEESTVAHDASKVLGLHLKKDETELFTISNFDGFSYNGNYGIKLPKGIWREVINSDSMEYAGSGKYINTVVKGDGANNQNISLGANSILIFEKIG